MYLSFIGIDGCGKDTIFYRIFKDFPNAVQTFEPGGTREADVIREIVLTKDLSSDSFFEKINSILQTVTNSCAAYLFQAISSFKDSGMSATTEMYLFAASRAETSRTVIAPALALNLPVFGRRSVACSMAYQGYVRGLGMDKVWQTNLDAISSFLPDFEIFFHVPGQIAVDRIRQDPLREKNRLDCLPVSFYDAANEGYKKYYQNFSPYRSYTVDATKNIEEVEQDVREVLYKEKLIN